jgi:ABC-type transporter Mla subunit MlaD
MDYQFFQILSERIDKASGDEKTRLEEIRGKLLDFTNEIDKQLEARYKQAQDFVDSLLAQDDIVKAIRDNLNNFTQDAVDVVNQMLRQASEKMMTRAWAVCGQVRDRLPRLKSLHERLLDTPDEPPKSEDNKD